MAKTSESRSKNFLFQDLRPTSLIGMASDRMPGGSGRSIQKGSTKMGLFEFGGHNPDLRNN
jgi:hypothetical protein